MQIEILESNISYMSTLFGEMDHKKRTEYMIDWIKIFGKTWRKWYDKQCEEYSIGFRFGGMTERFNGVVTLFQLKELLTSDINNGTVSYNSLKIVKIQELR